MLCCNDSDDETDDSYDDDGNYFSLGSIFKGLPLLQSKVKNKTLTLKNKSTNGIMRDPKLGKKSKLKMKESRKERINCQLLWHELHAEGYMPPLNELTMC